MPSFNVAIAAFITSLQTNAGLIAFVTANWPGKTLTVKQVFKPRTEVHPAELPLIMITRPELNPSYNENTVEGGHTLMLYYGFQQDDRQLGAQLAITFEEALRDALLADPGNTGTTENVTPGKAVNDEGRNHPHYFGVMTVDVMHKR